MACAAEVLERAPIFFFKTDSPHGLAKRTLLKKYMQSWVCRMFCTGNTDICYLDGFAGAGVYGLKTFSDIFIDEERDHINIERFGSPIIALLVVLDHFEKMKPSHPKTFNRSAKFIFIEKDEENVKKLTENVIQCLEHNKYKLHKLDVGSRSSEFICRPKDETYPDDGIVSVMILHDEFERVILQKLLIPSTFPVFAFVDPFGYSHTPMIVIKTLMSSFNVELFFNFMVQAVNRWQSDERKHKAINALFGCDIQLETDSENVKACAAFVNKYVDQLQLNTKCKTLCFCMRSAKNSDLYSLVFATTDYYGIKNMKESMNRVTQNENSFVFSDYTVNQMGGMVPFQNDQDSTGPVADFIFHKFHGQRVSLEEIERAVILLTPAYIFRKESLKDLEKNKKIVKVEFLKQEENWKRKQGTFPDDKYPVITFRSATEEEELTFKIQNIGIKDNIN